MGGGQRKEVKRRGKKAAMEEEKTKTEREVCWAKLRSIVLFWLWTPSCVPHWCVKPSLFMSSPMARQRMTSGPHQAAGPCPNAETTQPFDLLFLVLSTEPGCIVNMSTLLYCLIIRILFIWGLVCQGKSTDELPMLSCVLLWLCLNQCLQILFLLGVCSLTCVVHCLLLITALCFSLPFTWASAGSTEWLCFYFFKSWPIQWVCLCLMYMHITRFILNIF